MGFAFLGSLFGYSSSDFITCLFGCLAICTVCLGIDIVKQIAKYILSSQRKCWCAGVTGRQSMEDVLGCILLLAFGRGL